MKVFEFDDYKVFVHKKLHTLENKGHGQYTRIAEHLGVHTSMVSQVFNGPKDLTFEQACGVCSYFGLTELETDYFVALVQLARAKAKCARDILRLKNQAGSLKDRLSKDVVMSVADDAVFYSQWYLMAAKLLSSIQGYNTPETISEKLGVPLHLINKGLEFLFSVGLCVEVDGKIKPGPANTHLGADSPLVSRHHQNWRVKGFEKMGLLKPTELFLTMPATLSEKDVILLRSKIVEFIDEFVSVIDKSKGEVLYCLNIDWFDVCK
jgi:uncharacterized protein (TIGR02147 family)